MGMTNLTLEHSAVISDRIDEIGHDAVVDEMIGIYEKILECDCVSTDDVLEYVKHWIKVGKDFDKFVESLPIVDTWED